MVEGLTCSEPVLKDSSDCVFGRGPRTIVLWGDSHAAALVPAFRLLGEQYGRAGFIAVRPGCSPTATRPGLLSTPSERDCYETIQKVVTRINASDAIDTVIVASWWSHYTLRRDQVEALVKRFPDKKIIIQDDNPTPGFDVPWALALQQRSGQSIPRINPSPPNEALQIQPANQLQVIALSDAMCSDGNCPPSLNGQALYRDQNHVSRFAAEKLIASFLARTLWRPTRTQVVP